MFNIPAITWPLTAVLLLSGCNHLLQAARSRQRTEQVNNTLHALMHVLMAAMLWNLAPSTMLAQIAVLTGAALWFIIQAVARPEFKTLCADGHGRLKCVYHSLTMAGAALMIAMMAPQTTTSHQTAPPNAMDAMAGMGRMTMSHNHHAMAAPLNTTAGVSMDHSPALAILLTAIFTAAAITFIILLLRARATKNTHYPRSAHRLPPQAEHGLEALGAAAMALMFATMTT
ncbi:DUF5134 domain-containing protein [Arthrobacter dokdonensis]|uniref:DUF5134 domain-containing protein n=1 Tax=Arthrobacter dokdonellae TaxID=2211210 RepID=UPI000DE5A4BD|nr:DUF5134 domain-containing protein [Arthrobacter dokdonellae]